MHARGAAWLGTSRRATRRTSAKFHMSWVSMLPISSSARFTVSGPAPLTTLEETMASLANSLLGFERSGWTTPVLTTTRSLGGTADCTRVCLSVLTPGKVRSRPKGHAQLLVTGSSTIRWLSQHRLTVILFKDEPVGRPRAGRVLFVETWRRVNCASGTCSTRHGRWTKSITAERHTARTDRTVCRGFLSQPPASSTGNRDGRGNLGRSHIHPPTSQAFGGMEEYFPSQTTDRAVNSALEPTSLTGLVRVPAPGPTKVGRRHGIRRLRVLQQNCLRRGIRTHSPKGACTGNSCEVRMRPANRPRRVYTHP